MPLAFCAVKDSQTLLQGALVYFPGDCCCRFSGTKLCLTLCNPMDCTLPGFPILHYLPEFLKFMSIELVMPSNPLILCHPLSFSLQSFPTSGSFPMSQFFTSGGQSIGVSASASILPMNIQGSWTIIFICLQLCWVFIALCRLSQVAASRGHSCTGSSLQWPLLLRSVGFRARRSNSCVTQVPLPCHVGRCILTHCTTREVLSHVRLCDPMDGSPPGFSVHGILQARILEWIATPFSRGTSQPRDWTLVSWIAGGFFITWATGKSKEVLGE